MLYGGAHDKNREKKDEKKDRRRRTHCAPPRVWDTGIRALQIVASTACAAAVDETAARADQRLKQLLLLSAGVVAAAATVAIGGCLHHVALFANSRQMWSIMTKYIAATVRTYK